MSSAPTMGCTVSGRPARRASRAVGQPGHQGPRRRLAGVRKAGSCPGRGVCRGVRLHYRAAHHGRAAPARHRLRRAVRADPARPALEVCRRRRSSPASSPMCCGWPMRPGHSTPAARNPWRGGGRPGRPQRAGGARRVGHPPAGGAAGPGTARVQLRPRASAGQHHPAAAAGTHPGAAARARGRADAQVSRSAELVSGSPGDDRQRLLFLPRPA